MEGGLPVGHGYSRSREELSAGRLSLRRSAPVSYPVSRRQEVSRSPFKSDKSSVRVARNKTYLSLCDNKLRVCSLL